MAQRQWKYISDYQIATTLKWRPIIDGLQTGMKDFSDKTSSKIVQPLRVMKSLDPGSGSFVGTTTA